MADSSESIRITGLNEFIKEIKRLDDATLTKELKNAHYEVASVVVNKARQTTSTRLENKAAGSLRASRTSNRAQITYGGPAYPYAMGAEFGSNRYRQFRPHRGRVGYFLYPAIRASSHEILEIYKRAIDDIFHKAFPD